MNGQQRFDSSCVKTGRAAAAFGGEPETMNRRISEGGCLLEQVGIWSGGGAAKVRFAKSYDGQSRWPGNLAIWIDWLTRWASTSCTSSGRSRNQDAQRGHRLLQEAWERRKGAEKGTL
jgi:hypothetical protein